MNILLITETYLPFIGGVSTSSDSIARFMVTRGHTVTIVAPRQVIPGEIPPAPGLTVVTTPSIPDIMYRGKPMTLFPFGFPVIWRELRTRRFDVAHIQEPGSLGISAFVAAKLLRVPTVGALHFTPDQVARMMTGRTNTIIQWFTERYIRYIYNSYTAIMVPTQTFADFLHRLGVHKPIRVVSNGVNTDLFTPAKRSPPHRGTKFLYIGRVDKDKNVATLVGAMQYTHPDIQLIIACNGKEKDALIELTKERKIDQKIIWKGSISERHMIELYRSVDCFTIMAEFEIQSIVTLQALASGLPVLAANAGALPELVKNGENGYLIGAHDAKALAEKMNYLSLHPEIRKRMGERSRILSLPHHKPAVLTRLEDLYTNVSHA